jgi:hypothetical protein
MTNSITRFLSGLFGTASRRRGLERAYLNDSVSHYDLERREREIERGKFAWA